MIPVLSLLRVFALLEHTSLLSGQTLRIADTLLPTVVVRALRNVAVVFVRDGEHVGLAVVLPPLHLLLLKAARARLLRVGRRPVPAVPPAVVVERRAGGNAVHDIPTTSSAATSLAALTAVRVDSLGSPEDGGDLGVSRRQLAAAAGVALRVRVLDAPDVGAQHGNGQLGPLHHRVVRAVTVRGPPLGLLSQETPATRSHRQRLYLRPETPTARCMRSSKDHTKQAASDFETDTRDFRLINQLYGVRADCYTSSP